MPFVEVFATATREDQRAAICERLVGEVMNAEGAQDSESARAISWLVWHDVAAWSVGGRPPKASEPPRYVVRVSVPAGSMNDQKRSEMVTRVTTVLAEVDDDPDRMANEPVAWVDITEVPEGNWGALGRVVTFPEIAEYVLTGAIG